MEPVYNRCPYCGADNIAQRRRCTSCGELVFEKEDSGEAIATITGSDAAQDRPAHTPEHERPGCATAYAILLAIGAGLLAIGVVAGIIYLLSNDHGEIALFIIVPAAVGAPLSVLLAKGIWKLKNWARILVIVVHSLGVLSSLLQVCAALPSPGLMIFELVVGLAIGGYIIYWFASHGEYFS
jgi:hypothetical protein